MDPSPEPAPPTKRRRTGLVIRMAVLVLLGSILAAWVAWEAWRALAERTVIGFE